MFWTLPLKQSEKSGFVSKAGAKVETYFELQW